MIEKFTRRDALLPIRAGLSGLGGLLLLLAALRAQVGTTTEAKKRKGRKRHNNRRRGKKKNKKKNKRHKHHADRGKGGIPLETGSVLPERLITKSAGGYSAHMLLPFQEFSSEAQLAAAVADAERLNLFILPEASP